MAHAENQTSGTFIEAVKASLAVACRYNSGDSIAPAAILWTDAEGEWQPLVNRLRTLMPELVSLGEYNPEQATGPAIWLRCLVEGTLPEYRFPDKTVPILYLPKVSRQQLRSPEECPNELKPLVELQYRGTVWTQANGRDWTLEAFMVSENGGLGLDMARDSRTHKSLLGALDVLATTPISLLQGRKLEAEDFDKLMVGDTVRDLLSWISNPKFRESWEEAYWQAFCSRCKDEFGFDPVAEGELVAAERMGFRKGQWDEVWLRFTESPALYPGIPAALRRARPNALLFDREPWPEENEKDEKGLRAALLGLASHPADAGRAAVAKLEKEHSQRRQWVWAKMGHSPMALALEHLHSLASHTEKLLAGDSPESIADMYAKGGYRADDAMLRALASVKTTDDTAAVTAAIRNLYLDWLDECARNFQAAASKHPFPGAKDLPERMITAEPGECLMFVDGLRFDVAQRLLARAHERHLLTTEGYRLSALPSVTPTAKPAVTPAAMSVVGDVAGNDFCPVMADDRRPTTADRLRVAMAAGGYQVLRELETGIPTGEEARGWTESGKFDSLGHNMQALLANQIDEQVDRVLERIIQLLEAGWASVRVITDHGWLLAPGGLPAMALKKYMVECRWSRCAVIKEGAHADVPTTEWFWDARQMVACAPGVYCFSSGNEYAHGGMSPQECVTPDLRFRGVSGGKPVTLKIDSIQWLGQRCRVVIQPAQDGVYADLRSKPNDAKTSITQPKPFDKEGRAGLLVEDDGLAGTATSVVVVDQSGRVLSKQPTIVGGDH